MSQNGPKQPKLAQNSRGSDLFRSCFIITFKVVGKSLMSPWTKQINYHVLLFPKFIHSFIIMLLVSKNDFFAQYVVLCNKVSIRPYVYTELTMMLLCQTFSKFIFKKYFL